jgi:hypothetical protein
MPWAADRWREWLRVFAWARLRSEPVAGRSFAAPLVSAKPERGWRTLEGVAARRVAASPHGVVFRLRHAPEAPMASRGVGRTANEQLAEGLDAARGRTYVVDLVTGSCEGLGRPEMAVWQCLAGASTLDDLVSRLDRGAPSIRSHRPVREIVESLLAKGAVRLV